MSYDPVNDSGDALHDLLDNQRHVNETIQEIDVLDTTLESLNCLYDHLSLLGGAHTPFSVTTTTLTLESLLPSSGYTPAEVVGDFSEGSPISATLESLSENIARVKTRIIQAIVRLLAWLKKSWNSLFGYKEIMGRQAKALQKQGAIYRSRTPKSGSVNLGTEIKYLVVGENPLNDADAIIRYLKALQKHYVDVAQIYDAGVLSTGRDLERALSRAQAEPEQSLISAANSVASLPFQRIAGAVKAMNYRDPRFGSGTILASLPMLGGKTLFIQPPEVNTSGMSGSDLLNFAARQRRSFVKFTHSSPNSVTRTEGTLRTANGAQIEQMAQGVLDSLIHVDRAGSDSKRAALENQTKALLKQAERLQEASGEGLDSSYIKSMVRFVRSYGGWINGPVLQMTTHLFLVNRAIISYSGKSLRAH